MALRFYIGYVVVVMILVLGVEMTLGTLYARYVIIYTGAIFLAGLLAGQRIEQAWIACQGARSRARAGTHPQRLSPSAPEVGPSIGGTS